MDLPPITEQKSEPNTEEKIQENIANLLVLLELELKETLAKLKRAIQIKVTSLEQIDTFLFGPDYRFEQKYTREQLAAIFKDKVQLTDQQASDFAAYVISEASSTSPKNNQTILACKVVTMMTSRMKDFAMITQSNIRKALTELAPKLQAVRDSAGTVLDKIDKSKNIDFDTFKAYC